MRRIGFLFVLTGLAALVAVPAARATVFLAKDEALALAFPANDRIEERVVILTDGQKTEIEHRARAPLESQLWTVYVGWKDGAVQGYAVIDSHVVRTMPETFMVVIDPKGTVRRVDLLAFHEPPEYQAPARWIAQFEGKPLDADLKLGAGIQGITGATLSAQAMTTGVRRALALVAVAVTEASASAGEAPASAASPASRAAEEVK